MALCERCGKGEGEWRCQVCGRVVCENCARPTDKGVFCADHVPIEGTAKKQEKKGNSSSGNIFKTLFFTMLVLTLGLGLIVAIGDFFISAMQVPSETPGFAQDIVNLIIRLKGGGVFIIIGMAALTALLGAAWLGVKKAS